MLVVTRRIGERMHIGDEVSVTVLDVDHGRVRLGFTGPRHVPIHREEIHQRIKAEAAEPVGAR